MRRATPRPKGTARSAVTRPTSAFCVFFTDSKTHPRPTPGDAPSAEANALNVPPAYVLTTLGAQIRTVRERIERIEESATTPAEDGPIVELPGVTVEDWGHERNRYALVSHQKPPREITQGLRRWGLRWMRSESAWVAYRNGKGRHAIEEGAKLYSDWWVSSRANWPR